MPFTPRRSRRAARTTASRAYAPTTARTTTPLLRSTPTVIASRHIAGSEPLSGGDFQPPVASLTHFLVKLVFAAPASFLSAAALSHAAVASLWHFFMKLLSAAPASFLSVACALQVGLVVAVCA